MKYRISTACCLLLHLTTFVFASPPPKEDLTHVLKPNNINHLLLGLDTSKQPVPCTLPFPSNDQSQQPSTDGPPPTTLTCLPAEITANVQQNPSKQKAKTYSELKASDNPEDQKRYRKMRAYNTQWQREREERLKASDKPEDQKLLLDRRAGKVQRQMKYIKRLRTSDKPEDQKRFLDTKAYKARWAREKYKELKTSDKPEDQKLFFDKASRRQERRAEKRREKLAGLSTQKRTQVNFGNLVGTSDVHVPSHTKLFGISISNIGPAQESQIQYDEVRYASKRAERNADTVCRDSNNLGRERELAVGERPLKRKKVNSGSLELSPVTDDSTCIGLGTSEVHVPCHTKLFGIIISNIGPTQESQIQYDGERHASERAKRNADAVCMDANNLGRETELAVSDRPLKRKKVNSELQTILHASVNPQAPVQ